MDSSLHQAPPSMGFSRQEYWSGLPFLSPGNLPHPGIEPRSPDFPGGSDGNTSVYNVGDLGSIPGLGRFPGEGNDNPLQYSCLENPMDGGAWCRLLSMGSQRVRHDWVTSLHSRIAGRFFTVWVIKSILIKMYEVKLLSRVWLFATPWAVACTRLLRPWDFLGKSTGVGCH